MEGRLGGAVPVQLLSSLPIPKEAARRFKLPNPPEHVYNLSAPQAGCRLCGLVVNE